MLLKNIAGKYLPKVGIEPWTFSAALRVAKHYTIDRRKKMQSRVYIYF